MLKSIAFYKQPDLKKTFYSWQGISAEGLKLNGAMESISLPLAEYQLEQKGITVLHVARQWRLSKLFLQKKPSMADFAIFFRQLATLIAAGIPLLQSAEVLKEAQEKLAFQILIQSIQVDIARGKTLAASVAKMTDYFDTLTCHLIEMGEKTGCLQEMLNRIALIKEKKLIFKNKIKQALLYPSIITLVTVIVSLILLLVIIPHFAELFQNRLNQLPAITRYVITSSAWLHHAYWMLFLPIVLYVITRNLFKKFPALQQHVQQWLYHLPILGDFMQKMILSQFTHSLAVSLAAGIPMLDALKMLAHANSSTLYRATIEQIHFEITKGQPLHRSLQKYVLFPAMLIQMVKIGEESGTLDKMLLKIAEIYESEIDHFIIQLSHLLEPLIMMVLGVLIGGIVIAMYLPIFKLGAVI